MIIENIFGGGAHFVILQLGDFLRHEIVEVRVKSVYRTIDADGDVVLADLVEERRYSGARQVSRSPRHDRANVPDVLAVLVNGVVDTQLR